MRRAHPGWRQICLALVVFLPLCGQASAQSPGDDLAALNNRVNELHQAGKYAEAIPLAERSLQLTRAQMGEEHPDTAMRMAWLALLYNARGRYGEAEPLYKRSLAINEKALGPEHLWVAASLNSLAKLYQAQGRYGEAEPLLKRSLAVLEKALGPEHPFVAASLNSLAELYQTQGRYAEAEPLYKRSLALGEKALGPEHREVATSLNNLAGLYRAQGRYGEAEPLLKRSLAVLEKTLGPEHPWVATSLNNLAELYQTQGRYAEAEPLYKRSLTIFEKALGPEHPEVATSLNNLAGLYRAQGRYGETEPLLKRSLAINEKTLGPEHPWVATSLNNLAGLYRAQGRYGEAEPLLKRSLAVLEKTLGPEHTWVAASLNSLALLALARRDWARAAEHWRGATAILQRRAERGVASAEGGSVKGEAQRHDGYFAGLVKMTNRLATPSPSELAGQAGEMFEIAQWAQASEAASSLAQMATRSAAGSPELAALVRERQDLVAEWQAKDKQLIAARSEPPGKRTPDAERSLSERLAAIDNRLAGLDARLTREFPDYTVLARAKPISASAAQAQLGEDEAFVLIFDTDDRFKPTVPEETFVWVVTKTGMRWLRSDIGRQGLRDSVAALRCGLDASAWGAGSRCPELLKERPSQGQPLPFDAARAHTLYKSLLGEAEDLIRGKHLLVVLSGALTGLPPQVLVTDQPSPGTPTAWLMRKHAVTVLPSVAALVALRRDAKPSRATSPFIGFGNPLLVGASGSDRRAWDKQACAPAAPQLPKVRVAEALAPQVISKYFRGDVANVEEVRRAEPLPETADELCAVARLAGARANAVYLGARASEKTLKTLSADGTLAKARVLHFATHGLLADETAGLVSNKAAEPALMLTPPAVPSEEDDGLLTASEITTFKLDADWVVLSACNTGGAGAGNAEALSGLARAFFYAGARALLVSHWYVDSDATVALITKTFAALSADSKLGRAEALRRAMLALADGGGAMAPPSAWAPFVVVGEGVR